VFLIPAHIAQQDFKPNRRSGKDVNLDPTANTQSVPKPPQLWMRFQTKYPTVNGIRSRFGCNIIGAPFLAEDLERRRLHFFVDNRNRLGLVASERIPSRLKIVYGLAMPPANSRSRRPCRLSEPIGAQLSISRALQADQTGRQSRPSSYPGAPASSSPMKDRRSATNHEYWRVPTLSQCCRQGSLPPAQA
jgi:hypothetical protein